MADAGGWPRERPSKAINVRPVVSIIRDHNMVWMGSLHKSMCVCGAIFSMCACENSVSVCVFLKIECVQTDAVCATMCVWRCLLTSECTVSVDSMCTVCVCVLCVCVCVNAFLQVCACAFDSLSQNLKGTSVPPPEASSTGDWCFQEGPRPFRLSV